MVQLNKLIYAQRNKLIKGRHDHAVRKTRPVNLSIPSTIIHNHHPVKLSLPKKYPTFS